MRTSNNNEFHLIDLVRTLIVAALLCFHHLAFFFSIAFLLVLHHHLLVLFLRERERDRERQKDMPQKEMERKKMRDSDGYRIERKVEYVCMMMIMMNASMNESTHCESIVILTDIQATKHHVSAI
jgi:hypothetical protein